MGVQGGNIGLFEDGGGNEDALDASGRLCNADDGGGLLGLDKRAVVVAPRWRKRGGRDACDDGGTEDGGVFNLCQDLPVEEKGGTWNRRWP